jgi:mono/diheme cytochrome c family protein
MTKGTLLSASIALGIVTASFTLHQQQPKPWNAPADAAKVANPVATNSASIAAGKAVWIDQCISCHGKSGIGDGKKAAQLNTAMPDLTTAAMQAQSDGSLFYKVSQGKEDMPSFKKKIPEKEDIWNVVNYMRTLKK